MQMHDGSPFIRSTIPSPVNQSLVLCIHQVPSIKDSSFGNSSTPSAASRQVTKSFRGLGLQSEHNSHFGFGDFSNLTCVKPSLSKMRTLACRLIVTCAFCKLWVRSMCLCSYDRPKDKIGGSPSSLTSPTHENCTRTRAREPVSPCRRHRLRVLG